MKESRAQISLEYLIVISFVFFLIFSVLGLAYFYQDIVRDSLKARQIDSFARAIVDESERVFFSGEPSRVVISVYLPPGVSDIYVHEQSLVISYVASGGISSVAFSSSVPLNTTISTESGARQLAIVALPDHVEVTAL